MTRLEELLDRIVSTPGHITAALSASEWHELRGEIVELRGAIEMSANDYQQLAKRTEYTPADLLRHHRRVAEETERDWHRLSTDAAKDHQFARLLHGMIGVCTEAGELQDMVKKALIYNKPFDRVNVLEECGDVLWYLALCLDACGFTMQEAMERNIAKLRTRYPDKFSSDKAINRDEASERATLEERLVPRRD